ncbi:MAG: nucleotidyltransferase [Opitutales bacterium]|nr:nucleotidyltransferase [Opitutales bacterium]NRA28391.1 nucleotidyltransferase [Opitutales bacterium]
MLNRHFQEFLTLLEDKEVKFMVIGGYAVAVHGFPRYTGDLDVFIAISRQNANNVLDAFKDFGFGGLGLTAHDFLEEEMVIEIGREPMKIQVLTGIDGVTFNECYNNSVIFDIEGQKVRFIGFEELMKNKQASPRAKDKIDLEELRKIRR